MSIVNPSRRTTPASLTGRPLPRLAAMVAAVVCLTLAAAGTAPASASRPDALHRPDWQPTGPHVSTDQPEAFLVTFGPDHHPRNLTATAFTTALGMQDVTPLADRVALVRAAPGRGALVAGLLAGRDDVAAVEPDRTRQFAAVPDDTSYPHQWSHQMTRAEEAWDLHTGGGTLGEGRPLVAVIDSGIDATHPDLEAVVVQRFRTVEGQLVDAPVANDCLGHGTAVAGVLGARGDNAHGVTGVAWLPQIIDVALVNDLNGCSNSPRDSDVIAAMSHVSAMSPPPLVINLSLGSPGTACSAAYQAAVDQALAAGVAVVSSTGNSGSNANSIPASCNGAIAVAAVDRDRQRASYSQFNPQVDLTGPGGVGARTCPLSLADLATIAVMTTSRDQPKSYGVGCSLSDPNGHRLEATQGTSFSTPYVSGVLALARQYAIDLGRPLTPQQAEAVLEATAVDLGPGGRDQEHGWGLVDAAAAMALVQQDAIPPLQPDPDFPVDQAIVRVADPADVTTTDPIQQAIAVSSGLQAGSASYAVLARVDDFADALAGAAVGLGIGPLLYTHHDQPLDPRTRAELQRVLAIAPDSPATVFVMGGTAAIPASVDAELQQMGLVVQRVAGSGREDTAAQASRIVTEQLLPSAQGITTRPHVFIASGRDFADAVSAGQMAAYYGIPTLVTNRDMLHPATAEEIQRLEPEQVWILGGVNAISPTTQVEIEALGFPTARLAGETRIGTALEVYEQYAHELAVDGNGALESAATVAVNLRHSFNDVLSATLIAGQGNWFLPLEGEDGSIVTDGTREAFCDIGGDLFVIGGTDRIGDATAALLVELLTGSGC